MGADALVISEEAAAHALLHASRYPHLPVTGVFTRDASGGPTITGYLPLSHSVAVPAHHATAALRAAGPSVAAAAVFFAPDGNAWSLGAPHSANASVTSVASALSAGAGALPCVCVDLAVFSEGEWDDPAVLVGGSVRDGRAGTRAAEAIASGGMDAVCDFQDFLDDPTRAWRTWRA